MNFHLETKICPAV